MSVNSQCNGAGLQIEGLGVPQLHVQTLRGPDSTRHHPHIHESREGLTRCIVETKQTFTDTGSGRGAPLVLKAAPSASQSKFNPHHKLFRSAQPPQEPPRARKLRSVTALPRLFISYTCAVFSHSSQASALTRTLNQHICMFRRHIASGEDFFYCLNRANEVGKQITASTSPQRSFQHWWLNYL